MTPEPEQPDDSAGASSPCVRNAVSSAAGGVVQAGVVHDGVHLHAAPTRPAPAVIVLASTVGLLAAATVILLLGGALGQPTSSAPTATAATTTSTPVSTGPTSGEPTASGDPGRYSGVQEQRVVELVPQDRYNWVDIEYWRHDVTTPGELQMDAQGLRAALGAQLAVVADSPLANRDRCSQVTTWRDRVEFSELHIGSQLCGRSHVGRFASIEVRVLPNSPFSDGRFTFDGITWN